MVIDRYEKRLSDLEKELKRLQEEYVKPDSDFEDPEISKKIIKNQIIAHKEDIYDNKEYISIYNKIINFVSQSNLEKTDNLVSDLINKLPKDLKEEIYEQIEKINEQKNKENKEKNINQNFENSIKEENKKIESKTEDSLELNGLDIKLMEIAEEINLINKKNDEETNLEEKDKLQIKLEEKKSEYNKAKNDLLNLLNIYKEKFNKEYNDLSLIHEGEEIALKKYKNDLIIISRIENKIKELNKLKKKCFENQLKIDELLSKYSEIDFSKSIKESNSDSDIFKVDKIEHKPRLTWKTAVNIAAGIGVGSTVYFTSGTLGVALLDASAGIAKAIVSKKRHLPSIDYNKEKIRIKEISGLSGKLKSSFVNLKTYLKSEEGLRDISWFLNSAIITGTSLSIGNGVKNLISSKLPPNIIDNPVNEVPNTTVTPKTSPLENIKIQNGLGNYNVSSGYDKASWALNHTNKEPLISQYINKAKSVFNKFAILNSDGSIASECTTPGMSIEQFAKLKGVDVSKVAVLVSDKSGVPQAWTEVGELVKSLGAVK